MTNITEIAQSSQGVTMRLEKSRVECASLADGAASLQYLRQSQNPDMYGGIYLYTCQIAEADFRFEVIIGEPTLVWAARELEGKGVDPYSVPFDERQELYRDYISRRGRVFEVRAFVPLDGMPDRKDMPNLRDTLIRLIVEIQSSYRNNLSEYVDGEEEAFYSDIIRFRPYDIDTGLYCQVASEGVIRRD